MDVLLGIDTGTHTTKGVACLPDGTVVALARAEHGLTAAQPGTAEQDAERVWWRDFVAVARELLRQLPAGTIVQGLGVSGCGPCLVPVDRAGTPLRPAILYGIDTRASAEIDGLEREVGRDEIERWSGSRLSSQHVGPKLLWLMAHEPDIYARTDAVLTLNGFLVRRLTGESVVDRHQAAYFAPFVDFRAGRWDLRYARGRVDVRRLPRIVGSDEVVGHVGPDAAKETGLPMGIPVVAGSTDGIADAVGVGVAEPGDLMVTYGSGSIAMLVVGEPRGGPNLWTSGGAFPGEFVVVGGPSTTGSITTWFRRELARDLGADDPDSTRRAHAILSAEAETSGVGARGVMVLPFFSGERSPFSDPQARGMFAGLSLAHTRGDLYRAALEGAGFALRDTIDAITGTGASIRRIVAVGGGTASRTWPQIVSDILGRPQELPTQRAGAARGDAFLAGIAVGAVRERRDVTRWVGPTERVEPDAQAVAGYQALLPLYRHLYSQTAPAVHALVALAAAREGLQS